MEHSSTTVEIILTSMPHVDVVVMEGSVLVNQVKPNKNSSFLQYAEDSLFPYLTRYQRNSQACRIDMVFDTYKTFGFEDNSCNIPKLPETLYGFAAFKTYLIRK